MFGNGDLNRNETLSTKQRVPASVATKPALVQCALLASTELREQNSRQNVLHFARGTRSVFALGCLDLRRLKDIEEQRLPRLGPSWLVRLVSAEKGGRIIPGRKIIRSAGHSNFRSTFVVRAMEARGNKYRGAALYQKRAG